MHLDSKLDLDCCCCLWLFCLLVSIDTCPTNLNFIEGLDFDRIHNNWRPPCGKGVNWFNEYHEFKVGY